MRFPTRTWPSTCGPWGLPVATPAGLEWCRALPQDFSDNTAFARAGKLPMPVLAVQAEGPVRFLGDTKFNKNAVADSFEYLAHNITPVLMDDVSHWIPEEEPERLSALLLDFFGE